MRTWPFCSKVASSKRGPKPRMRTVAGWSFQRVSRRRIRSRDRCRRPCHRAVRRRFRGPELPPHLELVGHVVVELLGGLGDGVFDDGAGGVFGAVVVDVDALVGGGFVEADGVDAGGGDAGVFADEGELAHDRDEGRGEGVEAEVGEPEAKVELIGHRDSLDLWGTGWLGKPLRVRR